MLLLQVFQIGMNFLAVRTLIVRKLHQNYGSISIPTDRRTAHFHRCRWGSHGDSYLRVTPQALHVGGASLVVAGFAYMLQDLFPHCLEGLIRVHALIVDPELIFSG